MTTPFTAAGVKAGTCLRTAISPWAGL